jgi:hypothetical protein
MRTYFEVVLVVEVDLESTETSELNKAFEVIENKFEQMFAGEDTINVSSIHLAHSEEEEE